MGRLINPGAGEITDRLTILSLKILDAEERGAEGKHFQTERSALLSTLRARTLNGTWFDQVLHLAATNAALWHAEDALRARRALPLDAAVTEEACRIAFRIQALNDRRSAIITAINALTGEHYGEEKLG